MPSRLHDLHAALREAADSGGGALALSATTAREFADAVLAVLPPTLDLNDVTWTPVLGRVWRVGGVSLRDVFRKDRELYEVVSLAEKPTVHLRKVNGDPELRDSHAHLVIGSPLFKEFEWLVPKADL